MMLSFFLTSLLLIGIKPKVMLKVNQFADYRLLGKRMLLGIFYSISAITIFSAYKIGADASQIGPINQSQVVLTVLFAAVLLGEKTQLRNKILGSIATVVGIFFLT